MKSPEIHIPLDISPLETSKVGSMRIGVDDPCLFADLGGFLFLESH